MSDTPQQPASENKPLELDELKQKQDIASAPTAEFSIDSLEVETVALKHKRDSARKKEVASQSRTWFIKFMLANVVCLTVIFAIYWGFFTKSESQDVVDKPQPAKLREDNSSPSVPVAVAYPKEAPSKQKKNETVVIKQRSQQPPADAPSLSDIVKTDPPKKSSPTKKNSGSTNKKGNTKPSSLSALDAGLFANLGATTVTSQLQFSVGETSQFFAFSSSGKYLASQHIDGTVQVWDITSKKKMVEIPAEPESEADNPTSVTELALSADGGGVLLGSSSGKVRYVKTSNPKQSKSLIGHQSSVTSMQFFSDNQRAATIDLAGVVYLWDLDQGKSIGKIETTSRVSQFAISPDNKWLATGHWNGELALYDLGKVSGKSSLIPMREWIGHSASISGLAINKESSQVVSWANGSRFGEIVRIWDLKTGGVVSSFESALPARGMLQSSNDGSRLLSVDSSGVTEAWDIQSGQVTHQLQLPNGDSVKRLAYLSISGDNQTILSVDQQGIVRVWNIPTKKSAKPTVAGAK